MISYDTDPYYHTLWDTKTGEKPFDVRTLTLRSFLSMVCLDLTFFVQSRHETHDL